MSCASFNSSCLNPSGDPLSTSSQFLPLSFSFLLLTALSILLSVLLPAHIQQMFYVTRPKFFNFVALHYEIILSKSIFWCRILSNFSLVFSRAPPAFAPREPCRSNKVPSLSFLPSCFFSVLFRFFLSLFLFLPRQPTLSDRSVGRGILFPYSPPLRPSKQIALSPSLQT